MPHRRALRALPLALALALPLAACGSDRSGGLDACAGGSACADAGGGADGGRSDAGADAARADGGADVGRIDGGVDGSGDAGMDAGPRDSGCGGALPPCDIAHVFDLADHMPERLSVMYSMSWFGLERDDPQGAGSDPSYGNWKWGGGCVAVNDPRTCSAVGGAAQRQVASNRRPLAGIYSSSGRDEESLRRVDLMLSILRRPCDDGARVDAWSVQLDSVKFTSAHLAPGDTGFAVSADYAYRASVAFYERADAAGMANVLIPGYDTTWYWHFGDSGGRGLTTQAARLSALEDDLVDGVLLAQHHPSAARLGGRLIVYLYTGGSGSGPYISVSDWQGVLANARNRTGEDFYAVGGTTNPAFFAAFDAIAPWLESGLWNSLTDPDEHARALEWTRRRHDALLTAAATMPGRVVWGGIAPGFDDYTKDWGACTDRSIPRDDVVLDAQFEWLSAQRSAGRAVRGMVLETWDDWTEGSEIEPDVAEGTHVLLHLRQQLGSYFGDPVDPAGDARLDQRWVGYGQARNCAGGTAGTPPAIDLRCP